MLKKARLVEIKWDEKQQQANDVPNGNVVDVQFNPQTLKLSFANKNAGGDQPGGSSKQFVGSSTTKMSVELLFDTTEKGDDVRKQTQKVAFFITPKDKKSKKPVPPGVRFEWGTFIFRGVVDSMDETLDYFSEEGVPLRATISLGLSRQDIEFLFGEAGQRAGAGSGSPTGSPGQTPLEPARPGDSVQDMAARNGNSGDWKSIAAANNIDDPLRLAAGSLLNLSAGVSVGAAIGGGISAGASFGASASGSLSAGASVDLGLSAGIGGGAGFGAGAGASAGASAGFGAGASAGASAGFGAGASAGFGAGASAGFGVGASAGFGASAGTGAGFTAEAGFGGSADAEAAFTAGGSAGASIGGSAGGGFGIG